MRQLNLKKFLTAQLKTKLKIFLGNAMKNIKVTKYKTIFSPKFHKKLRANICIKEIELTEIIWNRGKLSGR